MRHGTLLALRHDPSSKDIAHDFDYAVSLVRQQRPEAVAFYKSVFPNAKVEIVNDFMASFELEGQKFNALNGGPKYKFNEAISLFIGVEKQQEVDYFWNRLIANSGEESKCGWLKDQFGNSVAFGLKRTSGRVYENPA